MSQQIRFVSGRARHAGFSLIELMIAMVIGMVVVGAVLAAYLGAGNSSRTSRAIAQITEDASIAMNVMRSSISMVGYGRPINVTGGAFQKPYTGQGVFGCDGAFTDASLAIEALTCADAPGPDSIAVAYEADADNSVLSGTNVPLDCLGNALTIQNDGKGNQFYLAYNRFYVSNNQLMCRGPGSNTPQALADNVVDMKISYGVANVANLHQVSRYETGKSLQEELDKPGWNQAVSVRLCVVVRSADNVLDQQVSYWDCDGTATTPADATDRRMYRAFTSTIVMQNRLGNMR